VGVAVVTTDLPGLPLLHRGKVRDTYNLGDRLLIIATDRLSAFDVVLPTAIPGKGVILTGLSEFWFAQTAGLMPNHLISTDPASFPEAVPEHGDHLAGRTMLVRRAERIDVECVVRGYLAGSAWEEYKATGGVAGEPMPGGLRIGDRLPEPIFTPAAKVDDGHDVNLSRRDLATMYGSELAERLELMSLNIYLAASELAEDRHLILADTKFEFGYVDGELTIIDELLTPDSSRYWDAAAWQPGRNPPSFDKQFVRDWLAASGWDKQPPGPELPPEVVAGTTERYIEAYRRLTGQEPALAEIAGSLREARSGAGERD
jgi:phosphoribosylaminoimidazole-succinocarboxamide synthase